MSNSSEALNEALIARWLGADAATLMPQAAALCNAGHGAVVSYSRKVFIPLTRLCRDSCFYCTFATAPQPGRNAYLTPDEVLAIARAGRDSMRVMLTPFSARTMPLDSMASGMPWFWSSR